MSQGDQDGKGEGDKDLTSQIDRTMAEAEAAIAALEEKERQQEAAEAAAAAGGGLADDDYVDLDESDDGGSQDLRAELDKVKAELAATRDKWLRAVADLENYKKRVKREMDEAAVRTAKHLLPAFLPVMDNLERALEVAPDAVDGAAPDNMSDVQQLITGIELVRKEFIGALGKHGIEPIEAVGLPFDPAVHDALQQMDSPDHPPGVVIREFEKGYRMRDRLLRPARVIVAGAGSTGVPKEQSDQE
jgi:molecular chaperone GrpE